MSVETVISEGEVLELYQKPLSEIPIKEVDESIQKPIIILVESIIGLMKASDYSEDNTKKEKNKEYGYQIDQLVYHLYDLTPQEITLVESESTI